MLHLVKLNIVKLNGAKDKNQTSGKLQNFKNTR